MPRFFITGTNTDAGKTVTTAAILRLLRRSGHDAIAAKPVQTGILPRPDGSVLAPDMEVYRQASGFEPSPEDLPLAFQHGFEPACSPHLAAELAGITLSPAAIADKLQQLAGRHEILLAEGAGGLLVPLNRRESMLDLARKLGAPVILTADNALGMINHTLLTLHVLKNEGVPVAGIVINHTRPDDAETRYLREDNIRTLRESAGVPLLAILPYIAGFCPDNNSHWQILEDALRPALTTLLKSES